MKRLWMAFTVVMIVSFLILDTWAGAEFGKPFDELSAEHQGQLTGRLAAQFHENTYDEYSGVVTISPIRAEAFAANVEHYKTVFIDGNADYAIPAGAISSEERLRKLSAFYFWTSWAAVTTRPGDIASYTNNWPHEPLVGNRPTGDNIVWTGVSVIVLLAGISAMAWWYASRKREEEEGHHHASDPLALWEATPSQKATIKYFWVVAALILAQMTLGIVGNPIRQMEHEHDQAGNALAILNEFTDGYTPPEWACNTYRAMLDSLAQLECDMHQHIHKENNVLFPKAIELEKVG